MRQFRCNGILVCILLILGILLTGCAEKVEAPRDLSQVGIAAAGQSMEPISFEEAIELEAEVSDVSVRIAEDTLNRVRSEVETQTQGQAQYYRFEGTYDFENIPDLKGSMTTLVVAVQDAEPYLYYITEPATQIHSDAATDLTWEAMGSFVDIQFDQRSAVLGASGFICQPTGEEVITEELSNTLYPEFTLTLP